MDYLWLWPWLVLAGVNLMATISPGPAFVMTVRSALAHGRRNGILTAIGLGLGVGVHVLLVILGLAAIIAGSAVFFDVIKYAGAAYLVWMGYKGLRSGGLAPQAMTEGGAASAPVSVPGSWTAIGAGFWTNVLNPKAMVFFGAVYSQLIDHATPWQVLVLYGLTTMTIEAGWFSLVATILTRPRLKALFVRASRWIDRVCGAFLVALGIRLALTKPALP